MDVDDIGTWMMIGFIVIFFLGVVVVAYDQVVIRPLRAEDAQQKCVSQGYDIHTSYNGFFRNTAYGVKCAYVDYTRKQIDIDMRQTTGENAVLVVT